MEHRHTAWWRTGGRVVRTHAWLLGVWVVGCTPPPATPVDAGPLALQALPPLAGTRTTLEAVRVAQHAVETGGGPNPALVENQAAALAAGYGAFQDGPGDPALTLTPNGVATPPPGPQARLLQRFVHLADLQLADDESPTRLGVFDTLGTDAALRPQDPQLCRMANAAVRTINALHAATPLSMVVLGGDNVDSAQANELDWLLTILGGGTVECDSGEDNDLVVGPDNDGKDPFVSRGLEVPFKWVTGNHDVLVQGNLPVASGNRGVSVGGTATFGTRDYTRGGAVDTGDWVTPDVRRRLMDAPEMLDRVAAHGDGHGVAAGSALGVYAFDVPGTPLRWIVLDTGARTGGSSGLLLREDVDAHVVPLLEAALAQQRWVILASHHAVGSLSDGSGLGGTRQPTALLPEDWRRLLGNYPNVVLSMVGHSHRHRVRLEESPQGTHWWEVTTAAVADFPHQFRLVEILDQDNGWLTVTATAVDLDVTGDGVAQAGLTLGYVDYTTGWFPQDGRGAPGDRNVVLWIAAPTL